MVYSPTFERLGMSHHFVLVFSAGFFSNKNRTVLPPQQMQLQETGLPCRTRDDSEIEAGKSWIYPPTQDSSDHRDDIFNRKSL